MAHEQELILQYLEGSKQTLNQGKLVVAASSQRNHRAITQEEHQVSRAGPMRFIRLNPGLYHFQVSQQINQLLLKPTTLISVTLSWSQDRPTENNVSLIKLFIASYLYPALQKATEYNGSSQHLLLIRITCKTPTAQIPPPAK